MERRSANVYGLFTRYHDWDIQTSQLEVFPLDSATGFAVGFEYVDAY